ncbi:MAG: hypothetical protein CL678_02240 [Bdellovibrionaceae bacterium]|nr:hypothetical protein [Pseudobdellovibrionaceae bacterium]|tara:strand:+ start:6590 stop:7978 length:1389 start_codon:yes stop_codon:yes gene_type:complete
MAGKSSAIYSLSISTSTSGGGDPSPTTHLPDVSGQTFTPIATTAAVIDSMAGAAELTHEEEHSRATPGQNKLSAIGVINPTASALYGAAPGEMVRVMYPDSVEASARFRTSAGADPTTHGYGKWLASGMALHSPSAATITTADAGQGDGATIVIDEADTAKVAIGAPIRIRRANNLLDEYAIVTQKEAPAGGMIVCKVHPAFEAAVPGSQVVDLCYAFYPTISSPASVDFHLRFAMGGVGTAATVGRLASMCRLSGFSLAQDNFGTSLTLRARPGCMLATDDDSPEVVETPEAPGALLQHRFGARCDIAASHTSQAAPLSLAREELKNFDWSVDVALDVAPGSPNTKGVLRGDTMDIHNATCTVTVTSEASATLQRMIAKDELRTLILGMGPAGSGQGGAFIIANCGRNDGSASPSAGDDSRIEQSTSLRAVSDFAGCDLTGLDAAGKRLATAPFMLVLPKV